MIPEANTATLRNALKNYVNAVNKLNNKNNAFIYGLLMKTKEGENASYKNRIVNGVAKIVSASRRALPKVMNTVVNGQPEGEAAAKVNTVTNKIKNLNSFMNGFTGGNSNALTKYYKNSKRNLNANRTINASRNDGPRYANLWKKLNETRGQSLIAQAVETQSQNSVLPTNNNNTMIPAQMQRPANQRPANQRPANQRPENQTQRQAANQQQTNKPKN